MTYYLPSTDQILRYILAEYTAKDMIDPEQALYAFYTEIESAIKIAQFNYNSTNEYIDYLAHFKRFIHVSRKNKDSVLRRKLDDASKLRKLNEIL